MSTSFPCCVEDIGLAVEEKVRHSSMRSAMRMNSAVVIFLDQVDQVDKVDHIIKTRAAVAQEVERVVH